MAEVEKALRRLPIRVKLEPGEALDSWLDRFCARLQVSRNVLYRTVGLLSENQPRTALPDIAVGISPERARFISYVAAVPVKTLHSMTLARYEGRALFLRRGRHGVDLHFLWARGTGSRYCPLCLRDKPGVWKVRWRLSWSFCCTEHSCILNDACSACGAVRGTRVLRLNEVPVLNLCSSRVKGRSDSGTYCQSDLSDAPVIRLPQQSSIVEAQKWLDSLIDSPEVDASDLQVALNDLKLLAGRALRVLTSNELRRYNGTSGREDCRFRIDRKRKRNGLFCPGSVLQMAHAVSFAAFILQSDDRETFVPLILRLISGDNNEPLHESPSNIIRHWGAPSASLQRKMLTALHPRLGPADALRYGTAGPSASTPQLDTPAVLERARSVPQRFWPGWTRLLHMDQSLQAETIQLSLSVGVLLPGYRSHDLGIQADALDIPHRKRHTFSYAFAHMKQPGRDQAVVILQQLADYLDSNPAPIDYNRRRRMSLAGLLSEPDWHDLARAAGSEAGPANAARLYLAYRLTGSLPEAGSDGRRSSYYTLQNFLATTPPSVLDGLDDHARGFLAARGVREPLSWEPPIELFDLPSLIARRGDDFGGKSSDGLVRRGLVEDRLLARIDAGATKAVAALIRDDDLDSMLRTAIGAGESIADMAGRFRKSRRMIRWHIDRLALTSLPRDKTRINPEQLRTLYVDERRTAEEIADMMGWSKTTIRRSLRESGTPMRNRGSGSGSIGVSADLLLRCPGLLKKTLTGPRSRQRLQRFVAVMSYPTLGKAAEALDLNETALIRQFGHLEGEVGGRLFVRANRRHPMELTPLGQELKLQALSTGVLATIPSGSGLQPSTKEWGSGGGPNE